MDNENITLEELATAARNGNIEVMPLLWEKTERLIKMLILKAVNKRVLPNYIDESDVLQCGYFALLAAVKAFKNNGLKFTSYLNYSVKERCKRMHKRQEPQGSKDKGNIIQSACKR